MITVLFQRGKFQLPRLSDNLGRDTRTTTICSQTIRSAGNLLGLHVDRHNSFLMSPINPMGIVNIVSLYEHVLDQSRYDKNGNRPHTYLQFRTKIHYHALYDTQAHNSQLQLETVLFLNARAHGKFVWSGGFGGAHGRVSTCGWERRWWCWWWRIYSCVTTLLTVIYLLLLLLSVLLQTWWGIWLQLCITVCLVLFLVMCSDAGYYFSLSYLHRRRKYRLPTVGIPKKNRYSVFCWTKESLRNDCVIDNVDPKTEIHIHLRIEHGNSGFKLILISWKPAEKEVGYMDVVFAGQGRRYLPLL